MKVSCYESPLFRSLKSKWDKEIALLDEGLNPIPFDRASLNKAIGMLASKSLHLSAKSDIEAYAMLGHFISREPQREYLELRWKSAENSKKTTSTAYLKSRPKLDSVLIKRLETIVLEKEIAREIERDRNERARNHPDQTTIWEKLFASIVDEAGIKKHGKNGKEISQFIFYPSETNKRKMRFGNISPDYVGLGLLPTLVMRKADRAKKNKQQIVGTRFEVDGESHTYKKNKDLVSEWIFRAYGIYTFSFENGLFFKDGLTNKTHGAVAKAVLEEFKRSSPGRVTKEKIEDFLIKKAILNICQYRTLDEIDAELLSMTGVNYEVAATFESLRNQSHCPTLIKFDNPFTGVRTLKKGLVREHKIQKLNNKTVACFIQT
jgi:hypothetical protein